MFIKCNLSSFKHCNKLFVVISGLSVKTPSYQGLKFLSDLLQLKETAILSDSDPDLVPLHTDSPIDVRACTGKPSIELIFRSCLCE